LALDPTSIEAAQIVTRLMLDPPAEVPPAVEAELDALDRAQMSRQGKLGALSLSGYALFVPLLLWFGIESWGWVAATYGTVVVTAALMWWAAGRLRITMPVVALAVLLNTLVFLFVSRFAGPYLLIPALGVGAMATTAGFPLLRRWYTPVFLAYL